jgi:predicted secreted protein
MDGEGSVRVRPDAGRIRVGVVSEGASPTEVARENATRMNSVIEAIKKAVGEPALSNGTVELRTDIVTLNPIYAADQGLPRGRSVVNGYRANNSVRIWVRDLHQRSPESGDPSKGLQVDGIFGPQTDGAVRGFQQALSFDVPSVAVDGIVGPVTWRGLVSGMLAG